MTKAEQNANSGASGNNTPVGYLNKAEMATRLRKTTRTIDSYMALGILPYMKIGRSVLFDWEDCQRHFAEYFRVSRFGINSKVKGAVHE